MPRIKATDDLLILELRITPPDGQPITDWKLSDDHVKFVAYQEGGGGTDKALHYHCYIEYKRSRTLLIKWIYSIAHCNHGQTGNAVFFTRKPHSHTFGYIAKSGNVAHRHNVSQTTLEEWFHSSEEFLKSKETDRKRKLRSREKHITAIKQRLTKDLQDGNLDRNVGSIVDRLLAEFTNAQLSLPSRTSMETLSMSILYPFDAPFVRSYYMKTFSFI